MITTTLNIVTPESEYPILAYLENISVGRNLSDPDVLLELILNIDVLKVMTIEEVEANTDKLAKLIYYRYPRFFNNIKVVSRRVNLGLTKSRLMVMAKYI